MDSIAQRGGGSPQEPTFDSFAVEPAVEERFEAACAKLSEPEGARTLGRVVQIDRSLPLVCTREGSFRAEHAARLIKKTDTLAAIGDWVVVDFPPGHDNVVIQQILPRKNFLSRPDRGRRGGVQTLAANIDTVFIVVPIVVAAGELDHLERQLVLAYQSGADPVVVLSKSDEMQDSEQRAEVLAAVEAACCGIPVVAESKESGEGIERICSLIPAGDVAVMLGKSGVGKSSLLNAIVGDEAQRTGAIRETDGEGRHTTIARRMVVLPQGGLLIDSPGLRSFRLTGSNSGVELAFPDIAELATGCRFRDCTHTREPGCAVNAALESGELDPRRLRSYLCIAEEVRKEQQRERY